jgi:hypothetical protein
MRILRKLFFAISCVAFFTHAASAGPIYSNIGAGFPGDAPNDYQTASTFFGTTFTTTAAGTLSSLEIDIKGATSPVTVGLYTSSAGQPGTLLESWSAVRPVGTGFPPPAVTTLTSVLDPSYWRYLDGW